MTELDTEVFQNVLPFPQHHTGAGKQDVRSRQVRLGAVLPKILGVLWEDGAPRASLSEYKSVAAMIACRTIEITIFNYAHFNFPISVYSSVRGRTVKVLSLHISTVPDGSRYFDGRCHVSTWRRGNWEETLLAADAAPRSIEHLATAGIHRSLR